MSNLFVYIARESTFNEVNGDLLVMQINTLEQTAPEAVCDVTMFQSSCNELNHLIVITSL